MIRGSSLYAQFTIIFGELFDTNLLSSTCNQFITLLLVITTFRFIMYLLFLENVSEVKIDPLAWSDARVQEVTKTWCRMLRIFHALRVCVLIAALLDKNDYSPGKQLICIFNFLMDVHWLKKMTKMFFFEKNRVAIIHRSPWPPMVLQVLCVLAGVLYYGSLFIAAMKSHPEL